MISNNNGPLKKPLTTGDVAAYCHVAYRSVQHWVECGKLQAYTTPGGHYRIQVDDFLAFLRKYKMPVPKELKNEKKETKILIVDDEKYIVDSIQRIIAMDEVGSYAVDVAYDGFVAGEKFITGEPDLMLLDIRMPGIDGYEVVRRIRKKGKSQKTKIIAMSAFFKEEGKKTILSLGVDACLDKPFTAEELLQLVHAFSIDWDA